ncbi:hypothetical protein VPDG_00070 [Vibrio phage henriette 12B8]|uniref:hypothetical protein n=1 Tax=Vibrio phage henriette 12B8 TaxID=573174 RepID=UPI0002C063B2|nr:hypothetical protein VPDG_00070 [Vibrio phage henriette 12B8]AGG58231.1 hypothetical protein VPDG_00070 [Vibrio phage henriette 12B8]
MIDGDKLLKMFVMVHGEFTSSCYAQVTYDDEHEPNGVACMKDGRICWEEDVAAITFNYLTKDWGDGDD